MLASNTLSSLSLREIWRLSFPHDSLEKLPCMFNVNTSQTFDRIKSSAHRLWSRDIHANWSWHHPRKTITLTFKWIILRAFDCIQPPSFCRKDTPTFMMWFVKRHFFSSDCIQIDIGPHSSDESDSIHLHDIKEDNIYLRLTAMLGCLAFHKSHCPAQGTISTVDVHSSCRDRLSLSDIYRVSMGHCVLPLPSIIYMHT